MTNARSPLAARQPRPFRMLAALACLVALAAAGCSSRGTGTQEPPAAASPRTTPAPAVTAPPTSADGPVSLGDAFAYAAIAHGDVTVRAKPAGGRRLVHLPATLPWGTPTPFLVREARRAGGKLWYQVLLPMRPNESTGWVAASQVRTAPRSYGAQVDLSERRLTLYRGADAVRTFAVAIGQPDTPTPTGRFFVTVKLRPPQVSRFYGAWALGLSAYSEVLDQFGTGDGQIALHGTNNGADLGQAVSHGCVRLSNPSISTLARLLPPGSPVDIRP
ncbi:MAG TPA: L,D-transpeptidase [Actinomycetes bacterium]|nr:L,D-transpeptidase [Actinomycetes bacterium]